MGVGVTTGWLGGGTVAGASVGVGRGVMVGRAVGNAGVGATVGVVAGALLHAASAVAQTAMSAPACRRCVLRCTIKNYTEGFDLDRQLPCRVFLIIALT